MAIQAPQDTDIFALVQDQRRQGLTIALGTEDPPRHLTTSAPQPKPSPTAQSMSARSLGPSPPGASLGSHRRAAALRPGPGRPQPSTGASGGRRRAPLAHAGGAPTSPAGPVTDAAVPEGHQGLHGFLYGEGGAEAHDGGIGYTFREVGAAPGWRRQGLLQGCQCQCGTRHQRQRQSCTFGSPTAGVASATPPRLFLPQPSHPRDPTRALHAPPHTTPSHKPWALHDLDCRARTTAAACWPPRGTWRRGRARSRWACMRSMTTSATSSTWATPGTWCWRSR